MKEWVKKHIKLLALSIFISFLFPFLYYQNNNITINKKTIQFDDLPEAFKGFKILQISDLHNKSFGANQEQLIGKIFECQPDVVVVTGDSIDKRKYNEKPCLKLMAQIAKKIPTYYVTGNHEKSSKKFNTLQEKLRGINVNVLRNTTVNIVRDNHVITILGIDDPTFFKDNNYEKTLEDLVNNPSNGPFAILLSHRPERMKCYTQLKIDLVLSGHAHGGQVRLPIVGGVIAPNQGFFPKYDAELYDSDKTTMVVSRGLGNSLCPIRLFNQPEIVVIVLDKKSKTTKYQ